MVGFWIELFMVRGFDKEKCLKRGILCLKYEK